MAVLAGAERALPSGRCFQHGYRIRTTWPCRSISRLRREMLGLREVCERGARARTVREMIRSCASSVVADGCPAGGRWVGGPAVRGRLSRVGWGGSGTGGGARRVPIPVPGTATWVTTMAYGTGVVPDSMHV